MNDQTVSNDGPIALRNWVRQIGISPVTAWRWQRAGWLDVFNVGGRSYLTKESRERFQARAASGEFAKQPSGVASLTKACRALLETLPAEVTDEASAQKVINGVTLSPDALRVVAYGEKLNHPREFIAVRKLFTEAQELLKK